MIVSKEYVNELVKNLFSIRHDENKDICALLRAVPDVESYRIFLEEYFCFKIAMAYSILLSSNFLGANDSIHTGKELIGRLIDGAYSVIETNVIRIPNFFSNSDGIKDKFYDRFAAYEEGKGLYFHYLFKDTLPASMKDKIDDDELFNVIYGAYHLVKGEIENTIKNKTAQRELTFIRCFFPNIGNWGELSIAFIIYFIIPIIIVRWFSSSMSPAGKEMNSMIYSVASGVYLLRYSRKISDNPESTEGYAEWLEACMVLWFLILIGRVIVKS